MKKGSKKVTAKKDVVEGAPPESEFVATIIGAPAEAEENSGLGLGFQPGEQEWLPSEGQMRLFQINTKYIFSDDNNNFVGEIKSFDPLVVWEWSVVGGVQSSQELSIESLDEYQIVDAPDEVFQRLSQA